MLRPVVIGYSPAIPRNDRILHHPKLRLWNKGVHFARLSIIGPLLHEYKKLIVVKRVINELSNEFKVNCNTITGKSAI